MTKTAHQTYESFILRCWLVPDAEIGEQAAWRFELVDVSAEPGRWSFTDLDQILVSMSATLQKGVIPERADNDTRIGMAIYQTSERSQ